MHSWGKMVRDSEKKKMHAMRGRKDLDSRMLGGIVNILIVYLLIMLL
jgi:hypothetical protein